MGDAFENALDATVEFLPKLLGFLLILIIGYFIAKLLAKIVAKVLQKVGFDRLVERGGVKQVLDRSQFDASDILAKIVFYAVMLFVLSLAFGVFGQNPISDYLQAIIAYLPKVFVAILIIVIAAAIAAGAKTLIQGSLGGLSYGKALANLASILILALGVIAALNQLEIAENVVNAVLYAFLAAIVGIAIVAIGGGGITPMRSRWEQTLNKYDEEKPKVAEEIRNAPSVSEQASQARDQAQQSYQQDAPPQQQYQAPPPDPSTTQFPAQGQGSHPAPPAPDSYQPQGQDQYQPDQGPYQPQQGQYPPPEQGQYQPDEGQYPPEQGQYPPPPPPPR